MNAPVDHAGLARPWRDIAREVIDGTDVSMGDLFSTRQQRAVAWARHEVMYRLATETSMSNPRIGAVLGNRDASTVFHGVKAHALRRNLPMPVGQGRLLVFPQEAC